MNKVVLIFRILIPATSLILFSMVGLLSRSNLSSMDHVTYVAAFALWTLLPYILWIILSYMNPGLAPFVTSGGILLLFSLFIHVRFAIARPQLNALSLLVAPLFQIILLLGIYGLWGLVKKMRASP